MPCLAVLICLALIPPSVYHALIMPAKTRSTTSRLTLAQIWNQAPWVQCTRELMDAATSFYWQLVQQNTGDYWTIREFNDGAVTDLARIPDRYAPSMRFFLYQHRARSAVPLLPWDAVYGMFKKNESQKEKQVENLELLNWHLVCYMRGVMLQVVEDARSCWGALDEPFSDDHQSRLKTLDDWLKQEWLERHDPALVKAKEIAEVGDPLCLGKLCLCVSDQTRFNSRPDWISWSRKAPFLGHLYGQPRVVNKKFAEPTDDGSTSIPTSFAADIALVIFTIQKGMGSDVRLKPNHAHPSHGI